MTFHQTSRATSRGASHLLFVCPRYEGVDHRVRAMVDLELSIGDYVLSGGELPAMVVIDAVLRLLPGAIDAESTVEESFAEGLLEYPQYTRPAEFEGMSVPDVLVSGHHGADRRVAARASEGQNQGASPGPPGRLAVLHARQPKADIYSATRALTGALMSRALKTES